MTAGAPGRPKLASFETVDTLPSTQDRVRRDVRAGAALPFAVRAEVQTRGRGRRGRTWVSPRGGLWLSLAVERGGTPASELPLTIPAALACARAIEAASGVRPQLKWPNDLYVAERKLGGLLVDVEDRAYVIGVGVNVAVDLDELPRALRRHATSIAAEQRGGPPLSPAILAIPLAEALLDACARWTRGDDCGVLDEAWSRSMLKDREVTVEPPGNREPYRAKVIGMGDRGELLVRRSPEATPEVLISAHLEL